MNKIFTQPTGPVAKQTNKQAIARKFGVKQNEVAYFAVGVDLGGYKVIYDKSTQRAYSLPVLPVGTTATSLSAQAVLVHSAGTVDLGELAATRREFVSLSNSFATGLVVNTRNELLFHNGIGYTYLGSLPVTISEDINPVGNADWKPQTDSDLLTMFTDGSFPEAVKYKYGLPTAVDGAVYRAVQDKLDNFISVLDFGAKGDGVADDTAAIKAAVATAASYSNRAAAVYFPGGFYNVSSTIELPSWVQLVGSGIETTQIRCTNTNAGHVILLPNNTQYNGIRGMTVRYAAMPTSGGIGIGIKSYHPYFWQIKVTDCYIGIKIYENDYSVTSSATGVFVEQFQINDCSQVGLLVGNSNSGFCNDITFRDGLMITNNPDYFYVGGIRVVGRVESLTLSNIDMIGGRLSYTADAGTTEGLRFSTFTGVFFDSGAARCEFGRMRHCQFTNCWISGGRINGTEGAYFTDVQNTTFTGLRVYNCGSSGLVFDNCSYINIVESSFGLNNSNGLSGGWWHIHFRNNCSHFTVQNCTSNTASGTIAAGVRVEPDSIYYTIEGNHFGQVTTPVSETNSNAQGRYVANNAFYTTYATGSGSLASGTTSTTISHGLAVVPQLKQVRIQQNGASASPLYVQAVNGTTITVATQASNTDPAPFTWEVDATRY